MGRVKDHYHEEIIAMADQQYDQQDDRDRNIVEREDQLEHNFKIAFHDLLFHLREKMAERNIGRFRFDIEVKGGTHDRQMFVEYMAGESYDSSNAKGNRLIAVVEEYCRRKGWQERNDTLAITDERPTITIGPKPGDPVF